MNAVAIIVMVVGIVGYALWSFGAVTAVPREAWIGLAVAGGLVALWTRRPSN